MAVDEPRTGVMESEGEGGDEADRTPEKATPPGKRGGGAETFHWVRFHNKSNPMDPDEVVLGVNGEVLVIQRNQRVPVPKRFLEVADHARYRHFTQEPGKDRKMDREIHKYPYDILGTATRGDFLGWKQKGTRANREHAERMGVPTEG